MALQSAQREELPVPVCANVHGALIKHNPRMAKFDFTFGTPLAFDSFESADQCTFKNDGGRD